MRLSAFGLLVVIGVLADEYYSNVGIYLLILGAPIAAVIALKRKRDFPESGSKNNSAEVRSTHKSCDTPPNERGRVPPRQSPRLPSRSINKLEFLSAGESTDVHGYTLFGPIWVGPLTKREEECEPAVIDRSQPVTTAETVPTLDHWPNYSLIDTDQRNRYLEWLSGSRSEIDDLGYLFIYFYGFERYVVRGAGNEALSLREMNLKDIVSEIHRLRRVFPASKSFDSYSNQLLDLIYILYWGELIDERKATFPNRHAIASRYAISKIANQQNELLDADWALHWILGHGSARNTKLVRDQYPVLRLLFKAAYLRATDGGMKVPRCRRILKIHPAMASRGLEKYGIVDAPKDWRDSWELNTPLKQLEAILDEVMPFLKTLGKAVAKKNISGILVAWPKSIPYDSVPKLKQLSSSVEAYVKSSRMTEVSSIAKLLGIDLDGPVTHSELKRIASALESLGFCLVPDPELTSAKIRSDEGVVCFNGERPKELSSEGASIALTCRLGVLLLSVGESIHHAGDEILRRIIKAHSNLIERSYLDHYLSWRLRYPPSTAGVKKQVGGLSVEQKHEIARLLIDIALSEGAISTIQLTQLENLFQQLGLECSLVSDFLHQSVSSIEAKEKTLNTKDHGKGVLLDSAALERHDESTREVQAVLGGILGEGSGGEADHNESVELVQSDVWHQGRLDSSHDALAKWLVTKDTWPLSSVSEKCAELGILVEGALDAINEASFESLGDSLIDPGDPVEVFRDVLPA